MRVRFWGTRGSIPVALSAAAVRRKLVAALTRAAGRALDTPARIEAFVEELDFAVSHTYGGNSSCVQLEAGRSRAGPIIAHRSRTGRARGDE